jgi:hypothetical protein
MQTTWNANAERRGVEVRFSERPPDETLATLKLNGWRWSRFAQCWYTSDTPEARALAVQLGAVPGPENTPVPKRRTVSRRPGDRYTRSNDAHFEHGLTIRQNGRGRCEDAPCCGCCD